jgi:hypothetical protein
MRSVIGAGTAAGARPSREAFDRRVFVRNAPPPGERPFAAREQQLQKNPGRALEPRAVESVQSRDVNTAQNVRVIGEQRGAVDARAAGARRAGGKPGSPSVAPGQLRPLDRSAQPTNESKPGTGDHSLDNALKDQSDAQQQEQRQRKAASEQKAAEQQKAERQHQADTQQQEQRQRRADSEQKAAEQQKAERQRQADTQQQEQRQRKANSEQPAAEQQGQAATPQQRQAECERQAILQHQDVRQCRSEALPQGNPDNPNVDKKGK